LNGALLVCSISALTATQKGRKERNIALFFRDAFKRQTCRTTLQEKWYHSILSGRGRQSDSASYLLTEHLVDTTPFRLAWLCYRLKI